ncbi:MAG: hypothetical protein HOJ35_05465 [Bdellovibrionales bacterium]|nr:hypothetical protein [Bdellovibrionales bacterium]
MKNLIFLISYLLILASCKDTHELSTLNTVYLNTKIGNASGGNAVKLFDIAADTVNNKIYIQSIVAPHVAVIDADSGELEKYIDTEIDGYHLSRMAVHTSSGNLFIADETSQKLIKIDTTNNTKTNDEFNFKEEYGSSANPGRIAVHNGEGLVIVSLCNQNKLVFIDVSTMKAEKVLDVDDGIYCPKGIKVRNEKIYVALSRDRAENYEGDSGNSAVAIIDPSDWSVNHFSVPYKGAEEIAVDAANGRYWLLSSNRLRFVDEEGNTDQYTTSGEEFRNINYSKAMDSLILLTRDGADSDCFEGAFGSVELFNPADISEPTTKYKVGMKSNSMALIGNLQKIYVSNMGDGTVSVVDYSEFISSDESNTRELDGKILNPRRNVGTAELVADYTNISLMDSVIPEINNKKTTYDEFIINSTNLNGTIIDSFIDYCTLEFAANTFKPATQTIDVGTSIEDMVAHPDGNKVYTVNRLGGNQVLVYDNSNNKVTEINVSNWPTRMVLDESRRELYIYSHFASAVDIINIDDDVLTASIDLTKSGVAQSRTHFIPEIAYDSGRQSLYISIPEQGLIVEVNTSSQSVTQVLDVFDPISDEDDHGDSSTNVGRVQLAVDGYSSKLFVFYRDEKILHVLDPFNNLSIKQEIDLGDKEDLTGSFGTEVLTMDTKYRRLFVGPHVYTVTGGTLTDQDTKIKHIEKVIGVQDDYLIGVSEDNNEVTVYAYEIKSDTNYDKIMSDTVSDMKVLPPRFSVDEVNEHLYVGYMERAKLIIYNLKEK